MIKRFLIGFGVSLIIVLLSWNVSASQPGELIERGLAMLDRGHASAAIEQFQQAATVYRANGNQEGIIGSQVNESLALQAKGLPLRACQVLLQALSFQDRHICQQRRLDLAALQVQLLVVPTGEVYLSGLLSLGDVLRSLGKLDASTLVLESAQRRATTSLNRQAAIALAAANTQASYAGRLRDRLGRTDNPIEEETLSQQLQQATVQAIALYQQAQTPGASSALLAQVNELRLLASMQQWLRQNSTDSRALSDAIAAALPQSLAQLDTLSFKTLPPIQAVYARLRVAQSLIDLNQPPSRAQELSQAALAQALQLDHERAQSAALGTLARLAQEDEAVRLYRQALNLARSTQSHDLAYQWAWELGQTYRQQKDHSSALRFYQMAVQELDRVRENLLAVSSNFTVSVQDKTESIYREYLSLLFETEQPDLEQAISLSQRLQLVEIENYLECGQFGQLPLNLIQNSLHQSITRLHLLNLDQRLEVIVQQGRTLHHYPVNKQAVLTQVQNLLVNLQDPNFADVPPSVFLPYSQDLYQQLIAPARRQGWLPESGTLVLAMDYSLQSIPVALLHDGNQYLIEQYSLATDLAGAPLPRPMTNFTALIAGVSTSAPSFQNRFQPLPEVETEVRSIQQTTSSEVLLNQKFTVNRLQQQLGIEGFSIVHLTTHGQFSSDPNATFLLAWDQPIGLDKIEQLVQRSQATNSLDLFVLSACQTAKGDRRSPLGIAGVAAQSGAQSTLASLWLVDADSTAKLMAEFYQSLKSGQSRSESLRQAQLHLLSQAVTQHPYYWAPFILVGSWL